MSDGETDDGRVHIGGDADLLAGELADATLKSSKSVIGPGKTGFRHEEFTETLHKAGGPPQLSQELFDDLIDYEEEAQDTVPEGKMLVRCAL